MSKTGNAFRLLFSGPTCDTNIYLNFRSEMHVPSVSVRFGVILEAYCHGNPTHMKLLSKQVKALDRMKFINEHVKDKDIKVKSLQ